MNYDSFLELVKKRRSIRRFKPDLIPDEYIDKIIEAARWAPSGFNTQPWEFVVVRKKELKDKIVDAIEEHWSQIHPEWEKLRTVEGKDSIEVVKAAPIDRNTPVFIILFGDWRVKVGLPDPAQADPDSVLYIYTSGLASAFLYMHLAAAALGLASQWISSARFSEPQRAIKNLLGIPEALSIYDMMALGYGAYKPVNKLVRAREDVVHYDDCGIGDFRTDEEALAFAKKTKAWTIAAHQQEPD